MERVSVIVSTYSKSNLNLVLNCLDSLEKQSLKPCETLLVLDPCPDLVEFYRSRLPDRFNIVVSNMCGLSNARNAGIKAAKGEIVAFIDDDAVAASDWLKNLVRNYIDTSIMGAGGLIKPLWESGHPSWFPDELNWIVGCSYKGLPENRSYVRNPIGCNMSFRKVVFEKVGYFKSDIGRFGKMLLDGEEPELSLRILNGIPKSKIIYDPAAIVYHRVQKKRARIDYMFKRSFFQGLSKAIVANQSRRFDKSMAVENEYVKYLIGEAIPARLKKIYEPQSFSQLAVILFCTTGVFVGFALGKSRPSSTVISKNNS
jgi:glycosyltransferase involved in cell wall biosynthesis